MRYINSNKIENIENKQGCVVMLGNFDGMHIGHLALFDVLSSTANASGLDKVIFSFWPHPMFYMDVPDFGLLLSRREKVRILEELGADVFIEYPFDDTLRNTPPGDFIQATVVDSLNAKAIVIGDDYCFGRDRAGDAEYMRELGKIHGFDVHVVDSVTYQGERVSSRLIRERLSARNLERCAELMTRPYQISGVVEHGKRLGRRLGFPTLNIIPPSEKLLPPNGVYLTMTSILSDCGGQTLESITNVGVSATVSQGGTAVKCETYLYDFDEDIYGQEVVISFFESLRGERRFKDACALKRQVDNDIRMGREMWKRSRLR